MKNMWADFKMSSLFLLGSTLFMVLSGNAVAQSIWTSPLSVESVQVLSAEDRVVFFTSPYVGKRCVGPGWSLQTSDDGRLNRLLSLVVAAKASGSKIEIFENGVCGAVQHSEFDAVRIVD